LSGGITGAWRAARGYILFGLPPILVFSAFVLLAPHFALRLAYSADSPYLDMSLCVQILALAWAAEYVGEMIAKTLLGAELGGLAFLTNATGVVDPADAIIVDGITGEVHLRPSADMEAAFVERVRLRARRRQQYLALRDRPCVTKDGETVTLMLNAGLVVDLPHITETGAAGIGLFRTELQFMVDNSDQVSIRPHTNLGEFRQIDRRGHFQIGCQKKVDGFR